MLKKMKHKIAVSFMMSALLFVAAFIVNVVDNNSIEVMAANNAGVQYQTHVQSYGWQGYVSNGAMSGTTGQAKRLEGIRIKLSNADATGSIQYRTHVQSYGWQGWVADGAMSGTSGEAKRLEAIEIKLTGNMAAKYDVYYRAYSQSYGWLGWAKNGATAGTAGYSYRLEAVQIKLVAKGGAAPGSTANAYRHPLVQYRTHVQSFGWQGYVKDGAMSGTTGKAKRLEGIQIALTNQEYSGGIQYKTHVQSYGWQNWVSNGTMSGTSGQAKRLEAIQIKLTGEMANKYDIYYRVHAQHFGWMGWAKNGTSAGTAGYAYRLEAIEIKIVAKGAAAPGSTADSFKQYVATVTAASVTLNKTSNSMTAGDLYQLTATVLPANTTNKAITWSSSNTAVATVSSAGKVKAVKAGTATITAKTSNGKTATCKITVSNAVSGTDTAQPDQEALYNKLFDINNKVTITMDITDAQLKLMQEDYNEDRDIYRKVNKMTVKIGSETYVMYEVGVRIKGNTSRVDIYNGNNTSSRNMIHFKLSFKETFDDAEEYGDDAKVWASDAERKARKNRTFATLKGLELKWNRNLDGTYVANYYANQMYRDMGVYAQNTSLANVNFGGYNYGVYTMYELVDEVFLERYFGADSAGDLYKCAWGLKNSGVGSSWSGATYKTDTITSMAPEADGKTYIYELKTNKKKSTNASLKNLINTLGSGTPSKTTFASVVDAENWVKFAAVSYFVGNPDDLRNNYNNHYVYFLSNGKAVFIPYDSDRCIGLTTSNKDMTTFSPYAESTALASNQENPVYLYSVTGRDNNYTQEYTAELKKVAESGWIDYAKYKKYYDIAKANYSSVAVPDSNIKLYVHNVNEQAHTYANSALAFSESTYLSSNMSPSTYLSKIMTAYNSAMAKWRN